MNTARNPVLADPKVRRAFEEELLVGEGTATLAGLVTSLGISQRELARRLGVSEARVSQILSGAENLTLRSLAAVAWALGIRFSLDPAPLADRTGTPASDDPPAPAWLARLKQAPNVRFQALVMPGAGRVRLGRPDLRVVRGQVEAA